MALTDDRRSTSAQRHPSHTARGRHANQAHGFGWGAWSAFFGNAAFALLGLAAIAVIAALAVAGCQPGPTSGAKSAKSANPARTVTATPQTAAGEWIPLRSTAAADILASARQSSLFQGDQSASGDHADLSRLGTPVFVRAIQPKGAPATLSPDFYVIPVQDATGAATDAAELEVNPARSAIQVIAIVTYSQPHVDGAIARLTASAAAAALSAQRAISPRAGASPELIYFPADTAVQATAPSAWTGGGEFPADPIWLVPGADGGAYVVGADGRVYDLDQLPLVAAGG
ncbi:MAG: hypothetical protein ACRDID_20935 [Ktedonobacterales bacterium]